MTDSNLNMLFGGIVGLAYLGLWIWALIKTGNNHQWGWFVAVFFLSPILLVIYLLFGRKGPA